MGRCQQRATPSHFPTKPEPNCAKPRCWRWGKLFVTERWPHTTDTPLGSLSVSPVLRNDPRGGIPSPTPAPLMWPGPATKWPTNTNIPRSRDPSEISERGVGVAALWPPCGGACKVFTTQRRLADKDIPGMCQGCWREGNRTCSGPRGRLVLPTTEGGGGGRKRTAATGANRRRWGGQSAWPLPFAHVKIDTQQRLQSLR